MLSLFAPHTAEECWELLGHQPSVGTAGWPAADPKLVRQQTDTCVIQVDSKVRARLEVPVDIAEQALRELAPEAPAIVRALAGRAVRLVVVRPPKLVNVVTA